MLWFLGNLLFYVLFCAVILIVGNARNYNALGGNCTNSCTDPSRFLEDQGGWDYYWKLKPDLQNVFTKSSVWVLYAIHQISVWALIFYAQLKTRSFYREDNYFRKDMYSNKLRDFNYAMIAINAIFHVLHLLHSYVAYDALAQDTAVASSQGSVIMMLVLILLLEFRSRGIAFGFPEKQTRENWAKKIHLSSIPITLIRAYHGYVFSWAVIYTFWYHPMEGTWGHATGFFLTAILMVQGSMMYTKAHLNTYFRLLGESWVTVHGSVVAAQTLADYGYGRFLYGFLWMFCMTGIFGLPFWSKISRWYRVIPWVAYLIALVVGYSVIKDENGKPFTRMWEACNIPLVLYLLAFAAYGLLLLMLRIYRACTSEHKREVTTLRKAITFGSVIIIWGLCVAFSIWLHVSGKDQFDLFFAMFIFTGLFVVAAIIMFYIQGIAIGWPILVKEEFQDPEEEENRGSESKKSGELKNSDKSEKTESTEKDSKEKEEKQ